MRCLIRFMNYDKNDSSWITTVIVACILNLSDYKKMTTMFLFFNSGCIVYD
jgi:hypothetical protein